MNADFLTKKEDLSVEPVARRPKLGANQRTLVAVVVLTLAGCCLVISSRHHYEGGQRPWRNGSLLQPLTQLMSLNFEYPTAKGTEIKWLIEGMGAAVLLLAAAIGWYARTKPGDPEDLPVGTRPRLSLDARVRLFFSSAPPASAAQMALLLFTGWTFLSVYWSPWPAAALGESCRQLIPVVWAIVLGRTLTARAVRTTSLLMIGVLALTAAIGVWYYYERNPGQRLKFPIGNPIFMAACLLPALTLSVAWALAWLAGIIRRPSPTQPAQQPNGRAPLWIMLAATICFAIVGWAFKLCASRGPLIGLGCGIFAAGWLALPKLGRRIMIVLVLVGLVCGGLYAPAYLSKGSGRAATARFRTYAWKYALDRFIQRPMTGTGQASYQLGAQAMSVTDATEDPAAFVAQVLGHAHSEWLEVLSELGAIGLALLGTALGITFWTAAIAFRRLGHAPNRLDRWCLLGLVATLAALIGEEATDSTMRTTVFPVIFYTVLGLIWALSASTEPPEARPTEQAHGVPVRVAGLLLGCAGALALAWLSVSDWQGARAHFRTEQCMDRKDWPGALNAAATAQRMRLCAEDRLRAAELVTYIAQNAAEAQFAILGDVALRAQRGERLIRPVMQMAADSAAAFDKNFDLAITTAAAIAQHMPYYPNVAGRMAGLVMMKGQQQQIAAALGLIKTASPAAATQMAEPYLAWARRLLADEYARNPLDAEIGLRLLAITPATEPLAVRLNLLRLPLRAGQVYPDTPPALYDLVQERGFSTVMNDWMALARAALRDPNASWADPYAPETLRLGALVYELQRMALQGPTIGPDASERAAQTANLAGKSAKLSEDAATLLLKIRTRFPSAAAYARRDQARYRLWSSPDKPEEALAIARQAIEEFPASGQDEQRKSFQEELSLYLLAAGREPEARENLRTLYPTDAERAIDLRLAAQFKELGSRFISLPPAMRPIRFNELMTQLAKLQADPPADQIMAAQLSLEQGNEAAAMDHLDQLRKLAGPDRYVKAVRYFLQRFPQSASLRLLAEQLSQSPQTAPAS